MVSVEMQDLEEALVCFVCLPGVASVHVNAADAAIDPARAQMDKADRRRRHAFFSRTPPAVQRMQASGMIILECSSVLA
jgi:hypothetical protein